MERHPGPLVLLEEVDLLIDFRFFIIAIVAVFLSLGLGIVLGSGFIGEPFLAAIEDKAQNVLENNQDLEREILELEGQKEEDQSFMSALEPVVLDGVLASEEVVIVNIEGTDQGLLDGIRSAVERADGVVASEVRINTKLSLEDTAVRDDLADVLNSSLTELEELRDLFGDELGDRLGAAATLEQPRRRRGEGLRPNELIGALIDREFLSVDATGVVVPEGAGFVIAIGSADKAPWPLQPLVESLSTSMAARDVPLVVAETSDSAWRVVSALRQGDAADAPLSTIDNAETSQGRIALALALDVAPDLTDHYGSDEGATAPIPTPTE